MVEFDILKIFMACLLNHWTVFVYSYGYLAKTCQLFTLFKHTEYYTSVRKYMPKPHQYSLDQNSPALISDPGIAGEETKARSCRTRDKEIKKSVS